MFHRSPKYFLWIDLGEKRITPNLVLGLNMKKIGYYFISSFCVFRNWYPRLNFEPTPSTRKLAIVHRHCVNILKLKSIKIK